MAHLGEVRARMADLTNGGARVLAVSFADVEMARAYAGDHALPFPIASDPDRAAYQAYGVGRGSKTKVWRVTAIAQHLWLRLRGFRPGRHHQEDLQQLGGDFVIGADGALRLCHPSSAGDDRASVDELLASLRSARRDGASR